LAVFTYGFSAAEGFVLRSFQAFRRTEKMGLQKKDLPNQSLTPPLSPYTDKAQLQVRKYRNSSRQVAIDQIAKIAYKSIP